MPFAILVLLVIAGSSSSLQAEIRLGDHPISSLEDAHLAVWKIQNFGPGEPFAGKARRGTAFAVAPDLFLTNYHVLDDLVYFDQPLSSLHLTQEGTRETLRVDGVLVLSGLYDVALVRTTTRVGHYLGLARNFTLQRAHNLSHVGYPAGKRLIVSQIPDTRHYEDSLHYGFGVRSHLEDFYGGSGGPVLDSRGRVVGMLSFSAGGNYIVAVKVRHLEELIFDTTEKDGLLCPVPQDASLCLEMERRFVERRAQESDPLALLRTGNPKSFINDSEAEWDLSLDRLRKAAEDMPKAQYLLGNVYYKRGNREGDKLAIVEYRNAARSGYPLAQYLLAFMHWHGHGTTRNENLAKEWAQRAWEGGVLLAEELLSEM